MTEARAWVRHVKRGTEYEVLGQAQMQTEAPVSDDAMVMVYRGRDGALWVRPTDEFRDGRFAPSPPPAAPCADEVEVVALAMWSEDWPRNPWEDASEYEKQTLVRRATIALAALSQLRQAERERARREGAEATRSALAGYTEAGGATKLAKLIRAFPLPPMGGV